MPTRFVCILVILAMAIGQPVSAQEKKTSVQEKKAGIQENKVGVQEKMRATEPPRQANPADGAAGCAGCGTVCGGTLVLMITIPIIILATNIAILVWVARDAKARSMTDSMLWMVLVMFTGLIGLLIYIFSRPQGNLVRCQSCENLRLQASVRCPHCGNSRNRPREIDDDDDDDRPRRGDSRRQAREDDDDDDDDRPRRRRP
jgi:hypothetical protein